MASSILLIGKPHSGKTTFIAQICARVETNNNSLKLYEAVENLSPIIEAVKALAKGEEVKTTPTDKSATLTLPLQHTDQRIDLNCPDYGGEQINTIIENREVDSKWAKSIKHSGNWVLFIRPMNLSSFYDLSNKTVKPEELKNNKGESEEYSISDQSSFIELLQILLHTKGQDSHLKNSTTKLTVVFTCWDELESPSEPRKELRKYLPLLLDFIESNWVPDKIVILGLSSQGFSLKDSSNKKQYQEIGSENFGYLVKTDGEHTKDITELILAALL